MRGCRAQTSPVARAKDQGCLTSQDGDRRGAVSRVVGGNARAIEPAEFAGRFVETQESMGGPGQKAPFGASPQPITTALISDQILKHHRDVGAAAVGTEAGRIPRADCGPTPASPVFPSRQQK